MIFGEPLFFILVAVVALVVTLLQFEQRRRREAIGRFVQPGLWETIGGVQREHFGQIRLVLVGLACLLIVIALARPKGGIVLEETTGEGIDIVFAMDISRSMSADDIAPSRFQVMKSIARTLVDQNPEDRIGVVAFAGEAFVQCPLTLDHPTVKSFIDALTFEPNIKQGTAVGEAIMSALDRFDSDNARVLILFTDGESNKGADPLAAARKAAERGIKVYTVGIGSEEGVTLMDSRDPFFGTPQPRLQHGEPVVVKLDTKTLQEVAHVTDGTYIGIQRDTDINTALLHLDKSAKAVFAAGSRQVRRELGPWFLAAAALLLAIDFLIELYRVSPLGHKWMGSGKKLKGKPATRKDTPAPGTMPA
ncbi:MAG: VWA domain-containing protein [bacterium]